MVNMEVWIPPQQDTMPLLKRYDVKECGSIAPPGYFGWFIPQELSRPDDTWLIFSKLEKVSRFSIDGTYLSIVKNFTIDPKTSNYYCQEVFCQDGIYVPEYCHTSEMFGQVSRCALLLTGYPDETDFVKDHIDQMKLYVKVAWVGPHLKHLTKYLTKEYMQFTQNTSAPIDNRYIGAKMILPINSHF